MDGKRRHKLSRLGLAALMVGSGTLHFVVPRTYQRIVPTVLGHAPLYVGSTGALEIVAGCLLAVPRTCQAGAAATFALLLAVWPANVKMALDGGIPGAPFPLSSALLSWVRVPLQVPLLAWAYRLARPDTDSSAGRQRPVGSWPRASR